MLRLLLITGLIFSQSGRWSAQAAEAKAKADPASTPSLPGSVVGPAPKNPVPPPPGTKTPADTFRELLAMSPAQRAQTLQGRTAYHRNYLEARVREYEALEPEEREARLQQFELSFRLPALMSVPADQRAQKLDAVPPYLRPIVEERLREFDLLPPATQKQVLEYETTANFFLRATPLAPTGHQPAVRPTATLPLPQPETEARAINEVSRFFGMNNKEREKTLEVLPAGEREEIDKTLAAFAKLPPEQRKTCIASFEKLSRMSREQRNEFLKNAERWNAMSAKERETWRTLIKTIPPSPAVTVMPPAPPGGVQ